MCGICGIAGFVDTNLVRKMTGAMVHRGPDSDGFYFDQEVSFGVRRLKVIDLVTGDQPIHNENKSVWIVYNGEIYNFKELRQDLIKRGHIFYTQTDTEVIVHLYEDYGEDCLKYLRGMFAFAIWDKKEKRLFLARDRVGIKPLYYSFINNRFAFASEIKSLRQNSHISYQIDFTALDRYLTFLYVPGPLTIFEGIKKLLPGHSLSLKNGHIDIKKYWQLDFNPQKDSEEGYIEKINENLKEIVNLHTISDVPLGVLLSGGLDSSTIVGLMSKITSRPIETFSIGYEDRFSSYNELAYADTVAKLFCTKHHQFIIKPDILKILPQIINFLDEPFADSSAILNYFICQEARKYVTVALCGIGGDELFGGYPRYLGVMGSSYYDRIPSMFRAGLKNIANFIPQSHKSSNIGGRIRRFLNTGTLSIEQRYLRWISYFNSEMKNRLYTSDFKKLVKDSDSDYVHKSYLNEINNTDPLDKISYLDIHTYLPDNLLIMADRMSMANSLELRVPFCDYKLIELFSSIPFSEKLKGFKLKSLFRKTIKDLLPAKIINKRKQGFMVPLADWLMGDLKDYVIEILDEVSIKKRGYFNFSYINELLNGHFKAKSTNTHQIWALLVFELWRRQCLD